MSDVINFNKEKVREYPELEEFINRLNLLIDDYSGKLTNIEISGAMSTVKTGFELGFLLGGEE